MSDRLKAWALGGLLRAHPSQFRADYGREILVTIRDQRRALPNATPRLITTFWIRVLLDLGRSAGREWAAESRLRATSLTTRGKVRTASGCLLVASAIANVAYDLSEPKLSMGVLAILLTAVSGLVGALLVWRRALGFRRDAPPTRPRCRP